MENLKLNNLTKKRAELSTLQKLLKTTQKQIDECVDNGNNALMELHEEFEELAERKRELLRDLEKLSIKYDKLKAKMNIAENMYGQYINAVKKGKKDDEL